MDKKKYSFISNMAFLMKMLFKEHKVAIIAFPLLIISQISVKIVTALIPSRAVYVIENNLGISGFMVHVGGILMVYVLLCSIRTWSEERYTTSSLMTRAYKFMVVMLEKVLVTDYCNRECNANQKLIGKANNSINSNWVGVERMLREAPGIVTYFIGLLIFGGAILAVDFRILLVLLFMLVSNILLNRYARKYLAKHLEENSETSRKFYNLQSKASDIVAGKDIRVYGMEKWFGRMLGIYIGQGKKWQKGVEKHFYLPVLSDTIFIALRDGIAYAVLIHKVFQGDIPLSGFTFMLGIVSGFSDWMFGFVNSIMETLKANEEVRYFREVLDMKDSFKHGTGVRVTEEMLNNAPEIELKDVSFHYDSEGEEVKEVLSHINLKIKAGEKIAIVGSNGGGKTTLVKLLCGFYHPTGGKILVNGIDIEDYNIEEYFKMLGVVFQDSEVLPLQITDIVSGHEKESCDMDRFWDAARKAGIIEKIESLPDKENTYYSNVFDENGIKFSGGELQKLLLAQCIYKDAPFLILDEPTAALDPVAESKMYEEYSTLVQNKTSIFISHRLASTRFCDRIIFIEDGCIAEEGTHSKLMEKNGKYAEVYNVQSHYYKDDNKMAGMEAAYG